MDSLRQPYAEMGRSAVKIPLMEVIASGATPILVVDALCVEMEPSGKKIIAAIRGERKLKGNMPSLAKETSPEDELGVSPVRLMDGCRTSPAPQSGRR